VEKELGNNRKTHVATSERENAPKLAKIQNTKYEIKLEEKKGDAERKSREKQKLKS